MPREQKVKLADLPHGLLDLESPPALLYVRGELPRGAQVAIVGTRHPSREGTHFAHELGRELARAGVAVLSGGAVGIDTAAHEGALAAGGVTVVVAPCGFSCPYPKENRELFRRVVLSGGAHVSLVKSRVKATQPAFFARNACLVALSDLVVVVEAPYRSGARNAAAVARRLGRPLFVVPSAPWISQGGGCLAELKLGAKLLVSVRDVLKQLEAMRRYPMAAPRPAEEPLFEGRANARGAQAGREDAASTDGEGAGFQGGGEGPAPPSDDRTALLKALGEGARSLDELTCATALPVERVQTALLALRLEGAVFADHAGTIRLVARDGNGRGRTRARG